MDTLGLLEGFVNIIIPVVFALLLQIIKALLANSGKGFKNPDSWLWIIIALGIPMALIDKGLTGFEDFNAFEFILKCVAYPAASALIYKIAKVGGKNIGDIFRRKLNG